MLPIIVADTAFEREHFALLTQIFGEGLEDYSTFTRLIGYTPAAVRALFELPEFEREVRRVRLGFLSPENATQRLRRKCDVLLENEILPRAHALACDMNVPPADRLRAMQFIKELTSTQKERDELRSAATGTGNAQSMILNITLPGGGAPRVGRVLTADRQVSEQP